MRTRATKKTVKHAYYAYYATLRLLVHLSFYGCIDRIHNQRWVRAAGNGYHPSSDWKVGSAHGSTTRIRGTGIRIKSHVIGLWLTYLALIRM